MSAQLLSIEREPLVRADAVAKYLDVDVNTVYRWQKEKGLPVIKIGKRGYRRYRISEVEAWLGRQRRETA